MKNNKNKGFTIIELVIVIAVIAILAAVLIPTFSGVVEKAHESIALQEVHNAYVETIADELATPDTSDDKIGNALESSNDGIVVKHENGVLVKISKNGETSVVDGDDYGYEIKNNKIVEKQTT